MGEEITKTYFETADFERFAAALRTETDLSRSWFEAKRFSEDGFMLGFEVEVWLLDHNHVPKPINETFLDTLAHPLVVPELSRFNVELNCTPLPLHGDVFRRAQAELTGLWGHCNSVAHGLDANMVAIGTLPTLREEDLTFANISPLKRYYALNQEILRQRGGQPLRIDISGREHLVAEHTDVMLEAATTSLQVHIQVPAHLAHRYYNASLMASGPVLAASVNAPFLFGKKLWQETRIPLFEQSVDLAGVRADTRRVTFGSGLLEGSLMEAFEENAVEYPTLLPLLFTDKPDGLRHLMLHNGTIWRWNRPLLGFDADGAPHLRIEHRTLPAGPSIGDMIANAALYVGLVHEFVTSDFDLRSGLSFAEARDNFYAAARHGLATQFTWPETRGVSASDLLLDELIPAAERGLARLGVDEADRPAYTGIVHRRVESGLTGAAWQEACLENAGGDPFRMMAAYCERQRSGIPVYEWDVNADG
jgi:hypothetical protein